MNYSAVQDGGQPSVSLYAPGTNRSKRVWIPVRSTPAGHACVRLHTKAEESPREPEVVARRSSRRPDDCPEAGEESSGPEVPSRLGRTGEQEAAPAECYSKESAASAHAKMMNATSSSHANREVDGDMERLPCRGCGGWISYPNFSCPAGSDNGYTQPDGLHCQRSASDLHHVPSSKS